MEQGNPGSVDNVAKRQKQASARPDFKAQMKGKTAVFKRVANEAKDR